MDDRINYKFYYGNTNYNFSRDKRKEIIMKKKLMAVGLVLAMVFSFASCKQNTEPTVETVPILVEDGSTLTYNEFLATNAGTEVCVAGYVQAKMDYVVENTNTSLFIKDQTSDNAYFVFNAQMTQDMYNLIVEGTPVRITGTKTVFSGEVEIANATVEILSAEPVIANTIDITSVFPSSASDYMNRKIQLTGFTVKAFDDGAVFHYGYNGTGSNGDAIYFQAEYNGNTHLFVVNQYLTNPSTSVYTAVQGLTDGQVITIQGFMYFYDNPLVMVTSIT